MVAASALPGEAAAQTSRVSREVVQPLPSREALELNAALSKLGRNPNDTSAVLDAGDAASKMGDFEAAFGFYERARQMSPGNARALAGVAGAMVHNGDPVSAIAMFDQAERAGAEPPALASERGLAYDLVGRPAEAQSYYRQALTAGEDDEASRRLAVSLAISGDSRGVERILLPLLRKQDKAAWRARAFSLAIMGKTKNARNITETLLPANLAKGIAPYLDYMPRLTAAQQAAAANLGKFPRASEIGRDEPRIAAFSRNARPPVKVAALDNGLTPAGQPLGSSNTARTALEATASQARRESAPAQAEPARSRRSQVRADEKAKAKLPRVAPPEPKPARTPGSIEEPRLATAEEVQTPAAIMADAQADRQAMPSTNTAASPSDAGTAPAPRPSELLAGKTDAAVATPGGEDKLAPAPGFDLAALPASSSSGAPGPGAPNSSQVPEPSFSSLFNDIGAPSAKAAPASGAVDIRKIEPAKPEPRKVEAKPKPPSHPSRIWVQIGIGQDKAALRFDWRRMSKQSPELFKGKEPHVSQLNRTNRMLVGPFQTRKAANEFVTALNKAGIEGPYVWSSPAGQVVDAL